MVVDSPYKDMSPLLKYFPNLTAKQTDNFSQLEELYRYWNERINVISRKDIDHLFIHHILHSLSLAKAITFNSGTRIIDIGTGGGFPGIPLAIFFPQVDFLLVDSIGKKINVVNEIASTLKLENVTAVKSRAEELDATCDFVVSRAVASISDLYNWTKHLVKPGGSNAMKNGWLFLKGGDLESEIKAVNLPVIEIGISTFFKEDFFMSKKIVYVGGEKVPRTKGRN